MLSLRALDLWREATSDGEGLRGQNMVEASPERINTPEALELRKGGEQIVRGVETSAAELRRLRASS